MTSSWEAKAIGDLACEVAGTSLDDEEVCDEGTTLEGTSVIPGSLCMRCGGSGVTRMMLTKIPHFRELIVSSFECDDCGERNTEVQFGGEIQELGCRYAVNCRDASDLDRQVIKSDSARVALPSIEVEIPAATQRGVISTVEGILTRAANELEAMQPVVVDALRRMAAGEEVPFELRLEDPSGNSFVQPKAGLDPEEDPDLDVARFERSDADNVSLGLHPGGAAPVREGGGTAKAGKSIEGVERLDEDHELMTFAVKCPHCGVDGEERMCCTKIPHFKECVIMSFSCAECGFRNAEVKAGGAVPLRGVRAKLACRDARDLRRDILKSDTASLEIPDLGLQLTRGTLGSIYTTVEGALQKIRASLAEGNPFAAGDSADPDAKERFREFLARLDALVEGTTFPFELHLSDPLANSFIGPRRSDAVGHDPLATFEEEESQREEDDDDDDDDDGLEVREYDRTWEEEEELGLHDIDTAGVNDLPVIDEEAEKPTADMVDHPRPDYARGCDDDAPRSILR
ncbi:hypothetical protein CTAYLR_009716 [Chrysophaeum taylorii]|uniref:Zinc finger ZPR1-type domain-containing protein n=1 Tax=Chrysophaeum taylorii TaxID=2483200 RepID=A0AAD7UEJ5_9STRA|nr:hypothetical protein CTAYLR_009716 [Chrysophaeum taylorii]